MICQDDVPLTPSSPFTQERDSLSVHVWGKGDLSLHVFLFAWACAAVYTRRRVRIILAAIGHTCE